MIIWYLILIYIIQAVLVWYYIHLAHSKGGIWEDDYDEINIGILCFVFIPGLQTLFMLGWLFEFPVKNRFDFSVRKFFNIKR